MSKSGYYAWKERAKSRHKIANEELLIEIRRVFLEHDKNYGSPRICKALDKEGIGCSENRVARLMQKDNLVAVQRRKYRVTTNSKHNWPVAPNIVNRNFTTDAPNKKWFTDMTYIWTYEGWLYLAFVLDLYNRSVVRLSMDSQMADELTQNALKQALMRRRPPEGLIHHSDRGSQYASGEYQELLKEVQDNAEYEPQGRLLGQRRRRKFRAYAEGGKSSSVPIYDERRSEARDIRVRRDVL